MPLLILLYFYVLLLGDVRGVMSKLDILVLISFDEILSDYRSISKETFSFELRESGVTVTIFLLCS